MLLGLIGDELNVRDAHAGHPANPHLALTVELKSLPCAHRRARPAGGRGERVVVKPDERIPVLVLLLGGEAYCDELAEVRAHVGVGNKLPVDEHKWVFPLIRPWAIRSPSIAVAQ